jgi:hypothetical protein
MNQVFDTAADAVSANDVSHSTELQHLDFSEAIADNSLDIHKRAVMHMQVAEALANIRVFDLENMHASDDALREIKRAHLMPLFLVEAFARHYCETLLRELTRGNERGRMILDPDASTYMHPIASGGALVVRAETVENDGQFTRRLTITFAKAMQEGGAV